MVPSLTTVAFGLGEGMLKLKRPSLKSRSRMSAVVATMLWTLTCEPAENSTPLRLTRMRLPLACRCPAMTEGSGPFTRLSATEEEGGWKNTVYWLAPMLKLCQLMAARSVVCVISVRFGMAWLMLAWPETWFTQDVLARAEVLSARGTPGHT